MDCAFGKLEESISFGLLGFGAGFHQLRDDWLALAFFTRAEARTLQG